VKVKQRYHAKGTGREVTTSQLIELGVSERHGQVEELEARVDHLVSIVASLIDRAGLSDEEVLKITGTEWEVEIDA